jgi:predicted  nucleic acid-binding Zn-ribbon protein
MSQHTDKQLQQLSKIETKVKALLLRYQEVKEQLGGAREEISRLQEAVRAKEEELKNFQNQDNIAKIVNNIAVDSANATELKLKINEYIREIDKCIAFLKD